MKKVIKKVEVVSTTSLSLATSEMAKREKNDCVVRAIASAFDVPYDLAHSFCAVNFKRQVGKGTFGSSLFFLKNTKLFGKELIELGESPFEGALFKEMFTYYKPSKVYFGSESLVARKMTVHTFLKKYDKGVFLVYVPRHCFTVRDGVVYGNPDDGVNLRRRIKGVWEIKS